MEYEEFKKIVNSKTITYEDLYSSFSTYQKDFVLYIRQKYMDIVLQTRQYVYIMR